MLAMFDWPVDEDLAMQRLELSSKGLDDGRLTAPVWPQQAVDFIHSDWKVQLAESTLTDFDF